MGMVPSMQTTSKMRNRFSAPARAKQMGSGWEYLYCYLETHEKSPLGNVRHLFLIEITNASTLSRLCGGCHTQ